MAEVGTSQYRGRAQAGLEGFRAVSGVAMVANPGMNRQYRPARPKKDLTFLFTGPRCHDELEEASERLESRVRATGGIKGPLPIALVEVQGGDLSRPANPLQ